MIVLSGSVARPKGSRLMEGRNDLGMLIGPSAWRFPWTEHWACDNDVFSHADLHNPEIPFATWWRETGEAAWLKTMDKAAKAVENGATRPLFCVLPDVVGDWAETIRRAWYYLPCLRERNLPVALALQDGLPIEQILDSATMLYPDYFFIGGTTEWKWMHAERIVQYGHAIGVRVHIGRAGGHGRVRRALELEADSCDGSKYYAYSDVKMPPLLRVLDRREPPSPQMRLSLFKQTWRMA